MNKKSLIKHLETEVYCRIKKSQYGVGVFAIRDIPKGTDPFKNSPPTKFIEISKKELSHLHPNIKRLIHDFCAVNEDKYSISTKGLNATTIDFFLNHSADPNTFYDEKTGFITIKFIKEGEELTLDYNTFNDQDSLEYIDF